VHAVLDDGAEPASPSRVLGGCPRRRRHGADGVVALRGASMGRISRAKRPSSRARMAFSCERRPSSSQSARVMPRFFAMRSADWN
jgi:hypothetical protein